MLEWAGGGDHIVGLDNTLRGFHLEAGAAIEPGDRQNLDAAAHRRAYLVGKRNKGIGNRLLRNKFVGTVAGEFQARVTVMPCRAIGDERVPALRAPALGNAIPLQNNMRNAFAA